jgi:hypothetical protein
MTLGGPAVVVPVVVGFVVGLGRAAESVGARVEGRVATLGAAAEGAAGFTPARASATADFGSGPVTGATATSPLVDDDRDDDDDGFKPARASATADFDSAPATGTTA